MDDKDTNTILDKVRSICFTVFNRLENNNNADFHSNGEEHFLDHLFKRLKGNITLFDVGGNVGGYSEILVNEAQRNSLPFSLHIFEPTASCFELLSAKFNGNKSIHLINAGASSASGSAEIFYDKETSGFASLYQRNLSAMNVEMKKKEMISLIRLEDYIGSHSFETIDFLKIDIEGHELNAFEGMGKYLHGDFVKVIQFEYGGANLDSRTNLLDLFTMLESKNFVIGKIMRHGIEIRTYKPWMDNFQYANYLAISKTFYNSLMK